MSITRDAVAALLAASPFSELELTGPGLRLHLRNSGGSITDVTTAAAVIASPAIGQVLWRHPLHAAALAPPGTRVRAGQPVALLQVGPLLRPVLAPADGVVGSALVPDGTLAGYGTKLLHFHPEAP